MAACLLFIFTRLCIASFVLIYREFLTPISSNCDGAVAIVCLVSDMMGTDIATTGEVYLLYVSITIILYF